MPITINGSGTVTGITAGGLPDGVITTDDIAADAVTSAKIASGAIVDADVNASAAIADSKLTGTTCKAWVNFDGTGTVAIRASYNVSSITDDGVGLYRVNFTAALTDANYCVTGSASNTTASPNLTLTNSSLGGVSDGITPTTSAVRVRCTLTNTGATQDAPYMCVAIFR
jgi:hypothetical protein